MVSLLQNHRLFLTNIVLFLALAGPFQGQIQDFLRGGLNVEVISEAGDLGGQL